MRILTFVLIFTSSISAYGQEPDSAKTTAYYQKLLEHAKNWKQEDEPWNKLLIQINDPKINIQYLQQSAHPFLAEYNRRLILESGNKNTDSLKMMINPGGRTKINVYKIINTESEGILIRLSDSYGDYYINPITLEYFEFEEVKGYDKEEYIGKIDGSENPLRFVDQTKEDPFKFE